MVSKKSPTGGADGPVLVIKNLTKQYGSFTALNDLTLSLNAGQILGLIGPNGAGKTTTIKILVGLSRPTSGTATIAGVDCVKESQKIKSLVGYMPDTFGSYDNMRVHEYLDFFGAAFGIAPRVRAKRIAEVMDITGTAYMKDRFVESLSHGMQQRIGLARTLRAFGTVEEIGRQVSQKRTIESHLVLAEQVAPAAAIIRKAIESDGEVFEVAAEATVRFRTSRPEAELGTILDRLIQGGIKVTQFREVQTDLEDAFMSFAKPQATASAKPAIARGASHV